MVAKVLVSLWVENFELLESSRCNQVWTAVVIKVCSLDLMKTLKKCKVKIENLKDTYKKCARTRTNRVGTKDSMAKLAWLKSLHNHPLNITLMIYNLWLSRKRIWGEQRKLKKESTWFKQMSRKWSFRWRYKSFWRYENNSSNHGTIIRTVTICKKIPCYIRDSACKCFIVKKAKLFWGHVKHILIYEGVRKCRILTGSWRLFGTLQLWGK